MTETTAKPTRLDDGDTLDTFVDEHETTLVEFYTKGCGKCAAMEPVLGNVAKATDVAVGLVNPGDDLGLLERFDVQSVPTLVLFHEGEAIARLSDGFVETDGVLDFLRSNGPDAGVPSE